MHHVRNGQRARGPVRHRLLPALLVIGALHGCGEAPTGTTQPDPDPDPTEYDHRLAAGASAADFLSATDYDRLIVQIQWVAGMRPSDAGLQHLTDFLNARLSKPNGITLQVDANPIPITSQATYSPADVRVIEDTYRTAFTEGRTIAAYFVFLDGEYSEAANVLGIAYRNTSMAIFQEKIHDNTGGALQPTQATVEGTVANHEVGHILGLVNNGSPMQVEHQDEPNGRHCDDPDCLMYYAVRTTDFLSNLMGGIPALNADCMDDLRANGGA